MKIAFNAGRMKKGSLTDKFSIHRINGAWRSSTDSRSTQ